MCFFIAGVQPKTRTIDTAPRRCPRCGLFQAHTRQVDHYLSLFFIPLIPIQRGKPFLYCQRCQQPIGGDAFEPAWKPSTGTDRCGQCGEAVQPGFKFCPHCGGRL